VRERATKCLSRSLPAQRVSDTPVPAPIAERSLSASALPRSGFAALAVHPAGQPHAPAQLRTKPARPPRPNRTGLPDRLKSGVEALSGVSLDGVKVHYNSPRPAQLDAHAYAHGREIHLAGGQEHHLPHEAWHLVQQAQGRVRPTMQLKGGIRINDSAGLEREADVMGARAAALVPVPPSRMTAVPETRKGQSGAEFTAQRPTASVAQLNGDEDSRKKTFFEGLAGGVTGFFGSLANVGTKGNFDSARSQAGQAWNVAKHPVATSSTLAGETQPHLHTLDVGRTVARTAGDMAGTGMALIGTTALAGLALKRPYLASRLGQNLLKKWNRAPMLQNKVFQHPKVAEFAVTRPLSAVVGGGLGAAAFYGSAGTRASDAQENITQHPELHKALEKAGVDQLGGSLLNRAVPRRRNPADE
jgi:hypothetical protein